MEQKEIDLKDFINPLQLAALEEAIKGEEGEFFIDLLSEIKTRIANMPKTYETDGQGDNAIAYLHYFWGNSDWYITEKDSENEQLQAFGYVCLNGDSENAEIGYISIVELLSCNIELDLYFNPVPLSEIKK